jgi:hypothetical protein
VRDVIGSVARNAALARAELAFIGFNADEYAVWITLLVYAFERGGPVEAGVVALVQLGPATLCAPFFGTMAERASAARVQAAGYLVQALGMGGAAGVLISNGPAVAVYACAAVIGCATTISRPTQAVLTPALARVPEELTAASVASGWVESAAVWGAPALTGVLLGTTTIGTVFVVAAVIMLGSAVLVAPVAAADPVPHKSATSELARRGLSEVSDGVRALADEPQARLILGFLGAQFVLWGVLDMIAVVLALSVLHLGAAGAGYLNAAFGAGGALGAIAGLVFIGRRRLAPPLVFAALVWGAAFGVLGVAQTTAGAFVLLAVAGLGRSVLDVAGRTHLQRVSSPHVLARVAGILEALSVGALALGAGLVAAIVELADPSTGLLVAAAVLPVLALVRLRALLKLDAGAKVPFVELALLRRLRIFAPLPAPELEGLAQSLEPVTVPAGTVVMREGDPGDRFYAIADGEMDITRAGEKVNTLGRGDGFGEIALLADVPRNATVTARTPAHLYALQKEPFVIALTGHEPTAAVAHEIVAERTPA